MSGTYRVELRRDERPALFLGELSIGAGETLDLGWLDPPAPGRIEVRLRGTEGRARKLVHLRLDDLRGNVVLDYVLFEWDEDEPLGLTVAPGEYRLSLWGGDVLPVACSVLVTSILPLLNSPICRSYLEFW